MKNPYKTLITLAVTAFISSGTITAAAEKVDPEGAAENADPALANEAEKLAKASIPEPSLSSRIETARDKFLQEANLTLGDNGGGRIVYWGDAIVEKGDSGAFFGKARTTAYQNAVLDAQASFLREAYGDTEAERIRRVIADDSENAKKFEDNLKKAGKNRLEIIWDKMLTLTDAKLNGMLEELGIDPKEFDQLRPSQRKTLFKKEFVEKNITTAIGQIAGLMVMQNFIGWDEDGTYKVGVLVMYSEKLRQLAWEIAHGHPPFLKKEGRPALAKQVPSDPEELSKLWGVRVLFNEHGQPCLASYSQWSSSYTGISKRGKERSIDRARDQALKMAMNELAFFIAGQAYMRDESEVGEMVEEFITKNPDGMISDGDAAYIIDKKNEQIRIRAKIDNAGVSTLRDATHKLKSGQTIVCKVLTWTLDKKNLVNRVRTFDPSKRPGPKVAGKGDEKDDPKRPGGVVSPKPQVDPSDF